MANEQATISRWQLAIDNWQLTIKNAWSHVQHELLYLSWGTMEVALFMPLAFSLLHWTRYWPPSQTTLWLLLIMFLPFNLARLMSLLNIPAQRQQIGMALALMLTSLVAIRTLIYRPESAFDMTWLADFFTNLAAPGNYLWLRDIVIFTLVIIMWWRGLRLATRNFSIEQIGFRLRLGIIILPLAIWLSQIGQNWNITPFVLLFFLAGLTALSLIRAEEIAQMETGFSASLSPRWMAYIFTASLFVVSFSGSLAAIISGDSLVTAVGWLSPLINTFQMGGAVIIHTILYLISPLLTLLAAIIDGLARWLARITAGNWVEIKTPEPPDFGDLAITPDATEIVDILAPPAMGNKLLAILLMVAVILVVSLALGRLFRQATFAARDSELIDGKKGEADEELGLGQRILRRLGLWRRWRAAASVRRIYRQMLQTAAGSGFPRGKSETPYEFLDTLTQLWPENTADSQLITQAFIKVRYGELPETNEELTQLETAWKRLKSVKPLTLEPPSQPEIGLSSNDGHY